MYLFLLWYATLQKKKLYYGITHLHGISMYSSSLFLILYCCIPDLRGIWCSICSCFSTSTVCLLAKLYTLVASKQTELNLLPCKLNLVSCTFQNEKSYCQLLCWKVTVGTGSFGVVFKVNFWPWGCINWSMVKLHIQLNFIEFELDVECHFLHSVNYKQFAMEFYFFFTFNKQSLTNSSNIYAKLCKVHWNFEHL